VSGVDNPLMPKPVPDADAAEIVTLADPEFVNVTGVDPVVPRRTLPKFTLVGLAERPPSVPVPLSGMDSVASDALLVIAMLPDALPLAVGANCAVKFTFRPAPIVTGAVRPVMLNPVPLVVT
jgi:hypothetical protein